MLSEKSQIRQSTFVTCMFIYALQSAAVCSISCLKSNDSLNDQQSKKHVGSEMLSSCSCSEWHQSLLNTHYVLFCGLFCLWLILICILCGRSHAQQNLSYWSKCTVSVAKALFCILGTSPIHIHPLAA